MIICLYSLDRLSASRFTPKRFSTPHQRMAHFGLILGERSSGETARRTGIPKTGNSHLRRALVEGAWAYRMKGRIGRHKVDRIGALPEIVRDIGWKAQVRLSRPISSADRARQDRQCRQCRYRSPDGRLHLVDRLREVAALHKGPPAESLGHRRRVFSRRTVWPFRCMAMNAPATH
jgi:hypothetical protein